MYFVFSTRSVVLKSGWNSAARMPRLVVLSLPSPLPPSLASCAIGLVCFAVNMWILGVLPSGDYQGGILYFKRHLRTNYASISLVEIMRYSGVYFTQEVEKRQLWVQSIDWLKLNFASCVVHQTRSLDVLILHFIYNTIGMVFVN